MRTRLLGSILWLMSACFATLHANSEFLDEDQKILLEWSYDNTYINFNITAKTTGWVGIGLSPNGGMPGSDIVTTWVKDGRSYLQDRYASRHGLPELDLSQDYTLLNGYERRGETFMSMRRKLDTGDTRDMKITAGKMNVIWAMSKDDSDPIQSVLTYHGIEKRGIKSMDLIIQNKPELTTPDAESTTSIPVESPITTGLNAYLDATENMLLEWEYSAQTITITVTAKTLGWFGIGFSTNGGMPGSDIITAWVKDGKTYLQDRYATAFALPEMDKVQNLHLISGEERDGKTIVKFRRRLNTCDQQDRIIDESTIKVIWAMASDGKDPEGESPNYHGTTNRGSRNLYLRAKTQSHSLPKDVTTFDMLLENVEIPHNDTTYYCQVNKAPQPGKKVHMIRYEPVIEKGNEGFVHHMVLYGCYDSLDREHHFKNGKTQFECYGGAMPGDLKICKSVVALWAVGGEGVDIPEEAGYPIGTSNSPDYFVLEIHYDNPPLLKGVRDRSGLRFYITETLRQYDSAILEAGQVNGIAIPPRQTGFISTSICSSNCTAQALPKEGINIFGIALHSHLAGVGAFAKQLRNGQDLGYIDADFNYDFNYQQYKILPKMKKLMPGDSIIIQCNYSTVDRSKMTYGGLSTRDEMCIHSLFYYPAIDLSHCMTSNLYETKPEQYMSEQLGVKNLTTRFKHWRAQFNELTEKGFWRNNKNVEAHQRGYTRANQLERCFRHQMRPVIQYNQETVLPPQAHKKPMKPKDETCDLSNVFG